jgi:hypothetical protein
MRTEDLARLPLPIRELPLVVWWFVRLQRMEGAAFFVILSCLLAWATVPNTDWRWFLFWNGEEGSKGRVVNAEDRGWLEGKKVVSRVYFEFERGGRKETGDSHFVGWRPRIDDEVRIEWPRDFPHITRIEDGRTAALHRGALAILFFALLALMMAQASWKGASPVLQGMRDGVPSTDPKEPGLVEPLTKAMLARIENIPRGVEVGFDGTWALDSSSRMMRPAIMAGLAAGSAAMLGRALFEMGSQL